MDLPRWLRWMQRARGSHAAGGGPEETAYCGSLEEIQEAIAKQLCADLDGEFEEFCEDDDYYEPVVEDYDFEYDMKQICPRYGLEAFDITYEGSDEGFEPYCGKGRW